MFIFGLLFLVSCQDETNPKHPCHAMILSDALPVQFWLSDCETFNETQAGGVHPLCWCQPFNCDDDINIQFQDDAGSEFLLQIFDTNDALIETIPIPEIYTGIYSLSFKPEDYNICDQQIYFKIYKDSTLVDNPTFEASLDPWSNIGSGADWDGGMTVPGQANVVLTSEEPVSKSLVQTFGVNPEGDYVFKVRSSSFGPEYSTTFTINLYMDGSFVYQLGEYEDELIVDDEIEVSIPGPFNKIELVVEYHDPTDPIVYTVREIQLTREGSGFGEAAKSDCLSIATVHEETELIRYTNNRNFAGLVYKDVSPEQVFNLRVPCRFFHERFPDQDEAIELTSSVVTISSNLKTQRLLEVQHVPYFFHKKLQLAIKHQYVEIVGKTWQKEESYSIDEGNKRWPLKSTTCLLTEKDSIVRNVL